MNLRPNLKPKCAVLLWSRIIFLTTLLLSAKARSAHFYLSSQHARKDSRKYRDSSKHGVSSGELSQSLVSPDPISIWDTENISGNASTVMFPPFPEQTNLTYCCYFTDKPISFNKSYRLFWAFLKYAETESTLGALPDCLSSKESYFIWVCIMEQVKKHFTKLHQLLLTEVKYWSSSAGEIRWHNLPDLTLHTDWQTDSQGFKFMHSFSDT